MRFHRFSVFYMYLKAASSSYAYYANDVHDIYKIVITGNNKQLSYFFPLTRFKTLFDAFEFDVEDDDP